MKKSWLIILVILLLYSCEQEIDSPEALLNKGLETTAKNGNWDEIKTKSSTFKFSKFIGGNLVGEENKIMRTHFPNEQLTQNYRKDSLVEITLTNNESSNMVRFEKGMPIGFMKLNREVLQINPIIGLLHKTDNLILQDTIWNGKEMLMLQDVENQEKYVFDNDSFLLEAKIAPNQYGTATTTFSDYKWVDGYLFAHKEDYYIPAAQYRVVSEYSKIEVNPKFNDKIFKADDSWYAIREGMQVPKFELISLNDGSVISNDNVKGKVTLIDFWATWCKPCINELPNIKTLYSKYKDKGFEVVSISIDSDKNKLNDYLSKNPFPWSYSTYLENGLKSQLAKDFQLIAIPKPILIDQKGEIIAIDVNAREEKLSEKLQHFFLDEN